MRIFSTSVFACLAFSLFPSIGSGKESPHQLKYCSGLKSFSASPGRPLVFGLEMNLLTLLTRPIISDDINNPGVLTSWHFDSNRGVLLGKVASGLRWSDGSPVTSSDVAHSIAIGLLNRMIGESIAVLGLKKGQPATLPIKGMMLKNELEFELSFESKIRNPKGAIIEALSVTSLPNRVWVGKFDPQKNEFSQTEFLSKQEKFEYLAGKMSFVFDQIPISVKFGTECPGGDFYSSPSLVSEDFSNFTFQGTRSEQTLVGFLNSRSQHLKVRESRSALISFVREALKNSQPHEGYTVVSSHFEKGEPGFAARSPDWNFGSSSLRLPTNSYVLELWMPPRDNVPLVRLTKLMAKASGLKLKWIGPGDSAQMTEAVDAYFAGSQIREGRQVWLQTALGWNKFKENLLGFPKTSAALETIRNLSSATLPVETKSLQDFENAAFAELAVFPAARYKSLQFSRKESVLELVVDDRDELTFRRRYRK